MPYKALGLFIVGFYLFILGCGGGNSNSGVSNDCSVIPGDPGQPTITAIVPPRGSTAEVSGQVKNVLPSDYRVAFYVRVDGGWWTKPTFAQPTIAIKCDGNGSFSCGYVTGGNDANADAFIFYVVRNNYTAPAVAGASTLPALDSVAKTGAIMR